jgi:hypothetical protein
MLTISMVTNAALKQQDEASFDALCNNWELRRMEENATQSNIRKWKEETHQLKLENVKMMKKSQSLASKILNSESSMSINYKKNDDWNVLQNDDRSLASAGSSFASGRNLIPLEVQRSSSTSQLLNASSSVGFFYLSADSSTMVIIFLFLFVYVSCLFF